MGDTLYVGGVIIAYFLHCLVDQDKQDLIASLRPQHRGYMKNHLEQIAFGGLAYDEEADTTVVCICLNVESDSEASDFVKDDPYWEVYKQVKIEKFKQMIPGVIT